MDPSALLSRLEALGAIDAEGLCATLSELEPLDAHELVGSALASGGEEPMGAMLGRLESLVGSTLGAEVASRYDELLTEVDAVRALEAELTRSHEHIQRLAASVRRVRAATCSKAAELGHKVESRRQMQQCAELLRRVQRLLQLGKRLHETVDAARARASSTTPEGASGARMPVAKRTEIPNSELPKAALAVVEAESLLVDGSLDGIEVVDGEAQFVRSVGATVRRQAEAMLKDGLRGLNQTTLGTALQVFYNLKCLRERVLSAVNDVASEHHSTATAALTNVGARAERGGKAGWLESLWLQVDSVASSFLMSASRLALLAHVLRRKRDPLSHTLFASLVQHPATFNAAGATRIDHSGQINGDQTGAQLSSTTSGDFSPLVSVEDLVASWPEADVATLQADPILGACLGGVTDTMANSSLKPADIDGSYSLTDEGAPLAIHRTASKAIASNASLADSDLGLLYSPLSAALCRAIVETCSSSSQLNSALTSNLPRLLEALLSGVGRLAEAVPLPAMPPDAAVELGVPALLPHLAPLVDGFRQQVLEQFYQGCDELVAAVQRVGAAAGGAGAALATPAPGPRGGEAATSSTVSPVNTRRTSNSSVTTPGGASNALTAAFAVAENLVATLSTRLVTELRRASPVGALLLLVARLVSQTLRMLAAKFEVIVESQPAGAVGTPDWAIAEAQNVCVLDAVLSVRYAVLSELADITDASVVASLRSALSAFEPIATVLGGPATPLPEGRRDEAARMLKQMLRAGLMDEGW